MKNVLPRILQKQEFEKGISRRHNHSFHSIDTTIQYNSNEENFPSLGLYTNTIQTPKNDLLIKRKQHSNELKAVNKLQREISELFPGFQIKQYLQPIRKSKPYHNNLPRDVQEKIKKIKVFQQQQMMKKKYNSIDIVSSLNNPLSQKHQSPYIKTHHFTQKIDIHKYIDYPEEADLDMRIPINKYNRYKGLVQLEGNRFVMANKEQVPRPNQSSSPSVKELAFQILSRSENQNFEKLPSFELMNETEMLKKIQESHLIRSERTEKPKKNIGEMHINLIMQAEKMDKQLQKDIKIASNRLRKNQFRRLQIKQKRGLKKIDQDLVNVLSLMHDDSFLEQLKIELSQ